jgi:hypothetical protein
MILKFVILESVIVTNSELGSFFSMQCSVFAPAIRMAVQSYVESNLPRQKKLIMM